MKVAAAPRDASWFAHPNVYSFKVVHASNGDDFARCMPVPLCESPGWSDLREVPHNVRCRRRACAKAFADAETGSSVQEPDPAPPGWRSAPTEAEPDHIERIPGSTKPGRSDG